MTNTPTDSDMGESPTTTLQGTSPPSEKDSSLERTPSQTTWSSPSLFAFGGALASFIRDAPPAGTHHPFGDLNTCPDAEILLSVTQIYEQISRAPEFTDLFSWLDVLSLGQQLWSAFQTVYYYWICPLWI